MAWWKERTIIVRYDESINARRTSTNTPLNRKNAYMLSNLIRIFFSSLPEHGSSKYPKLRWARLANAMECRTNRKIHDPCHDPSDADVQIYRRQPDVHFLGVARLT